MINMTGNYVYRACDLTSSAWNTLLLERQLGLRNKEAIKSEERKKSIIYYLEAFPGDGNKRSMYTDISRFTEKIVDFWTESWVFETCWWEITRITGILKYVEFFFPFALKDGLNFKGNEVKSKKNSKMWWNGTQNIYILIFMVLCILWIFSPKPSACFKAIFRLLLVPSKMYYWGLLWVGQGWGLWGLGTKSSFPHPCSNFCVFSPFLKQFLSTNIESVVFCFSEWW